MVKETSSNMEPSDEDIKLLFLLNGSCKALPPSYIKLRSYLNIHSSQVAEHLSLKLPKHLTAKSITCPFCFTSWSGDTCSFKLIPGKKLSAERRLRKRLGKLVNDSPESNQSRNKMILKCKVCSKISKFSLVKRGKVVEESKKEAEVEVINKKKKKKKDKSCGLRTEKVTEFKKSTNIQNNKQKQSNNFIRLENPGPTKSQKFNNKQQKMAVNPFAAKIQNKMSEKDKKRLKELQEEIKKEKSSARKTLEGFLSLVRT